MSWRSTRSWACFVKPWGNQCPANIENIFSVLGLKWWELQYTLNLTKWGNHFALVSSTLCSSDSDFPPLDYRNSIESWKKDCSISPNLWCCSSTSSRLIRDFAMSPNPSLSPPKKTRRFGNSLHTYIDSYIMKSRSTTYDLSHSRASAWEAVGSWRWWMMGAHIRFDMTLRKPIGNAIVEYCIWQGCHVPTWSMWCRGIGGAWNTT